MPRHHLAVLLPAYLAEVLSGRKRVECRLLRNRTPPYGEVRGGDFVWLKQSSGPVLGVARVKRVLDQPIGRVEDVDAIRSRYGDVICAQPDFWSDRRDVRFCTLLWLERSRLTGPIAVPKVDRRAWVVLGGRPRWASGDLYADRRDSSPADSR